MSGAPQFGIEKIRAYPSTMSLSLAALCEARDRPVAATIDHLLVHERSVMPPWEDTVTMAANAAHPMLTDDDRERVGLCIVATETPVDLEKPISSWLHRLLGLSPHCRNFEVKHACYGGTAALQMALGWLASPLARGQKALVVTTDASLLGIGKPYEFILGAGAVAMLLSSEPRFAAVPLGRSGVYAAEVTDVIRPTRRIETGSSEASLFAYLEAVNGTCDAYEAEYDALDWLNEAAGCVYHAPFGGITFRAHRTVLGRQLELSHQEMKADFERRCLPALCHHRRTGGVYAGSTFLSLLGLVSQRDDLAAGDVVSMFAYGSGSCAELYPVLVGDDAKNVARRADTARLLDERQSLTVAEYEQLERERDDATERAHYEPAFTRGDGPWAAHFESAWAGRGRVFLKRVHEFEREYAWS